MKRERRRIGLFGGSFDPPHLGHITLAQDAYENLNLDAVWFIPTFLSPHKTDFHVSPKERLAMLERMVKFDGRFDVCDIEVSSGTPQFSIDTVKALRETHSNVDFVWLIGADQLNSLHKWKGIDELSTIVSFVVFKRPGYPMDIPYEIQHLSIEQVDMHEVLISSSEIRERIQNRLPVYMFLHPEVNQHIEQKKFYLE